MRSLRTRLLLVSAVVLVGFLGLTGFALDRAFSASAASALRERLVGHLYALLSAADLNDRKLLELPIELPEPRFNLIGSGLMAVVRDANGVMVWRSRSALGYDFSSVPAGKPGERIYTELNDGQSTARLMLSFVTRWEGANHQPQTYAFQVVERLDEQRAQIQQFRRTLFGWLAAATVLLLVAQALIVRWGLSPLRRVTQDLSDMEAGRTQTLTGEYPSELQPLVDNLNALLGNARMHLQRYRDTLGNLAHSLKTPLAVLRSSVESQAPLNELRDTAQEQLQQMNEIVDYQLQRAAAAGRTALSTPLPVAPLVRKIQAALQKVYASKSLQVELDVADSVVFRGDEGDLLEILGNLADNAFKWARTRVQIRVVNESDGTTEHLQLRIEDDGPGIPSEALERVRTRGARADASTPGHGLGLAVVSELVALYNGRFAISKSSLGGAALEVRL